MVTADFRVDTERKRLCLDVHGHAGKSDPGKDIICSAASILMYTIAQYVEWAHKSGKLKRKPTIDFRKGLARVSCKAKSEAEFAELYNAYLVAQTGYALLAHNYHDNASVSMFGKAE